MGRGTLWAATAGPEPTPIELERIASELSLAIPADAAPSVLFRAMRTLLNLTQKEFGILISPGGATPISASVICQLETGLQPLPALLIQSAATATAAIQRFAQWRREEHPGCHDSALSALRALGAGCEAELDMYMAKKQSELPEDDRPLAAEYLAIVSKRKQSGACDRPATRGPYKKGAKEGEGEKKEKKEKKESSLSRGPRGPYKVKKRMPQAVGLSGELSEDGLSTPTSSSESASELSAASTCPNSPDHDSLELDAPDMRIGIDELRIFDELSLKESSSQGSTTGRSKSSSVDFLDRLEHAERRDQETLRSARENGVELTPRQRQAAPPPPTPTARSLPGRSPRDSPRGGEGLKRRNTRGHVLEGELTRDVLLSVVDLDKLNLDDFTLDELMASPRTNDVSLQGVDEIVDIFGHDLDAGILDHLNECEC